MLKHICLLASNILCPPSKSVLKIAAVFWPQNWGQKYEGRLSAFILLAPLSWPEYGRYFWPFLKIDWAHENDQSPLHSRRPKKRSSPFSKPMTPLSLGRHKEKQATFAMPLCNPATNTGSPQGRQAGNHQPTNQTDQQLPTNPPTDQQPS